MEPTTDPTQALELVRNFALVMGALVILAGAAFAWLRRA